MGKNKCNSNGSIKCDVESCEYNNCEEGTCTLDEIKVSCTCDNCDCYDTSETICQSFECKEADESDTDIDMDEEDEEEVVEDE